MIKTYSLLLSAALLTAIVGCDAGPPTYSIVGTVTLDGVPVENGCVVFSPHEGNGSTQVTGPLVEGKYHVRCVEGNATVTITGFGPEEMFVPVHYYDPAAGLAVDVQPVDEQTADFALSSKYHKFRRRR